jgi:GNAT superfamily N-acetyltransferase
MQVLQTRPENAVFVAEFDNAVCGLCHLQGVPLLASDGYCEVQALVVASSKQRLGVGRMLLAHGVAWAASTGYTRVRLRSGLHREDAHLFYESQGFAKSRASYAFEKAIPASAA